MVAGVDLHDASTSVLQVQRPGRGCLSYVVASRGEALVVDPTPDADFYVGLAAGHDVTITEIVDTHLHADHLSGFDQELFATIKGELTVHEIIEEEIFYPELKAHPKAKDIVLEGFEELLPAFVKIFPRDYKRALAELSKADGKGDQANDVVLPIAPAPAR